jgi:predicted Zn-dependent peptidase
MIDMFKHFCDEKTGESYLSAIVNGLNVIVIPKKDFKAKFAVYATKYGSVNNKFSFAGKTYTVPAGIAHFLEHKMFEKEYGDAFVKYSALGANANAFTSFDKTAYLFSCTDNFYESLEVLTEIVNVPYFTPQSVEKEQGIIGQEIQMGLDNPGNMVFYNLLKCLYKNHPIREEIAGSVESISEITADLLYSCYNAFYNPANMVLCVCGDIDENKVPKDSLLREFLGE